MVRVAIALMLLVVCLPSIAWAQAEKRIALVVTNQAYKQSGAALANTHRDGELVKSALEKVGFKVWVVKDTASEGALLAAIGEHVARLAQAGPEAVGFLYYSGHGAADRPDGANYLIPTDAPITHVAQLPLMAVRLDRITAALASAARMSFVVFDACRNVALQRESKDFGFKGFAPIREQNGMLLAYATAPGNVAVDQSLYARALADEIVKPGLEAGQVFRAVTRRVLKETSDKQAPEYLDRRLDDFQFLASTAQAPPAPSQAATAEAPKNPVKGLNLQGLMTTCLKEDVHPNGADIAARLAAHFTSGKFQYVWRDAGGGQNTRPDGEEHAHDILSVRNVDDEIRIAYAWQNGVLRLKPVAPIARATRSVSPRGGKGPAAPGLVAAQGIWLQDNGFGCISLDFNSSAGEAKGSWGIRTGELDADVIIRKSTLSAAPSPRPANEGLLPGLINQTVGVVLPPGRCEGIETQVGNERRCLKPKDNFKDCPECPEMVVVPPGEFLMGSPDNEKERWPIEGPQRKVTIAKPFAVGKFEATFVEWDACAADSGWFSGGCKHKPSDENWGKGTRPVINVSWDDAKEYISWLGKKTGRTYRLLTEAEWEYAARAGTTTPFSTGATITSQQANYDGSDTHGGSAKGPHRQRTTEVGSFKPNAFGLYDMHGNVMEWVEDCRHTSYQNAPTDASAWITLCVDNTRLARGGSWTVGWYHVRSAARERGFPDSRANHRGFRVARTLD